MPTYAMSNLKINYIKAGLYEIEEKNTIYKMEIIWLSRLQREIINYENSETPVLSWYNELDASSKAHIKIRIMREKRNNGKYSK